MKTPEVLAIIEDIGNKKKLKGVMESNSFIDIFDILKTASIAISNKRENIYFGSGTGANTNFTFIGQSNVNSGTVDYVYTAPISSFFQNDYAGSTAGQGNLLATFSNQDVVEFFSIATHNLMQNSDGFSFLLVTPQQDLQAMVISDNALFNTKVSELTTSSLGILVNGQTLLEIRLDSLLDDL